jgi:transposase-like protein
MSDWKAELAQVYGDSYFLSSEEKNRRLDAIKNQYGVTEKQLLREWKKLAQSSYGYV